MKPATWGLIGPGTIARNFADGLSEARSGELVAIASLSGARRQAFGHDLHSKIGHWPEKRRPSVNGKM